MKITYEKLLLIGIGLLILEVILLIINLIQSIK